MDETVLITGGTGVVGQRLVGAFAEAGYKVLFTSRSHDKIIQLQSNVCGSTGIIHDFSIESTADLLDKIAALGIKSVSYVVHAFRDVSNLKTDHEGIPTQRQWMDEYHHAVVIPYEVTMALASRGLKSAVMISSIYGQNASNLNLYDGDVARAPIHYNVAKAAENHVTRELAVRLGMKGIRVNAIAFGGILGRADEAFQKKYAALCPYKGMLEPKAIAGSVLFLCSEASEHITGQVIAVDGGWGIW